jgi:adenosylcobinamide-GDP ribazoletransferase
MTTRESHASGTSPGGALRTAVALFTALPLPGGVPRHVDRQAARRALGWLPVVGAGLGLLAGLPLLVVTGLVAGPLGAFLGATLAVSALALATRGLHLDGLADTIDGLGSGAESERALAIMRKPDIGAFGVLAIVLLVMVKVGALAAVAAQGTVALLALVVAEWVGRAGVVLAAAPVVPSAHRVGFGALIAGSAGVPIRLVSAAGPLALAMVPLASGAPWTSLRTVLAALVGLVVAVLWRRRVVRRLGGVTGDVFGSIIEIASTATVLAFALTPDLAIAR